MAQDIYQGPCKAWTLVELLAVCAIVAILAAVLFVVGSKAIQASKETTSMSNLSQIGKASALYAADHDDSLCHQVTFNTPPGQGKEGAECWRDALLPYTGSTDIFFAPNDPYARQTDLLPASVPEAQIRPFTSYSHSGNFLRFTALGEPIRLSQAGSPSTLAYLYEAGVAYVKHGDYAFPTAANGRNVGMLYLDWHVKRVPWADPESQ